MQRKGKVNMNDGKYSRAYAEVLEILKYLPKNEYDKIPHERIHFCYLFYWIYKSISFFFKVSNKFF